MIPQCPRIVKRIVRHLAVGGGAEIAHRRQLEVQVAKIDHVAGPGDEQIAELGDVFGPVGEDQRFIVVAEVALQFLRGVASA